MANDYYTHTGWPDANAAGVSASSRAENALIEAGFGKFPVLAGNDSLPIFVNSGATALEGTSTAAAQTALSLVIGTDVQAYDIILSLIAGLTAAADKIPVFTDPTTAVNYDFLDEDDMASNSATALVSQQSFKAYVDAAVTALTGTMRGPSELVMAFHQASAPSPGWTISAGFDNRAIFAHETSGGTVSAGSQALDGTSFDTETNTQTHSHAWSWSGNVNQSAVGQQIVLPASTNTYVLAAHDHAISVSDTLGPNKGGHSHAVSQAYGTYVIAAERA